jgi:hypothetical protein
MPTESESPSGKLRPRSDSVLVFDFAAFYIYFFGQWFHLRMLAPTTFFVWEFYIFGCWQSAPHKSVHPFAEFASALGRSMAYELYLSVLDSALPEVRKCLSMLSWLFSKAI